MTVLLGPSVKGEAYKRYVIKIVDSRGGDGIYVGPKINKSDLPMIQSKIRAAPESYISQVHGTDVVVSPTKWGRGVPLSGNGLANLSNHGKEFAVVVRSTESAASDICVRRKIRSFISP